MEVELYSYFRSSCSWRVRIALELKGIKYSYHAVNLIAPGGGAQHSEEYVKLNPGRVLPTLAIDGLVLNQSIAIMEYLEEARPDVAILPKNAADRAKVRGLCQLIASDVQPVQNQRILAYVGEKKAEWAKHWITVGMIALEKALERTAGKYCFGDEVTMADLCLVPQIYNAVRWGVDMSQFPIAVRIDKELSTLPAFVAAHAHRQPDTPEDLRIA